MIEGDNKIDLPMIHRVALTNVVRSETQIQEVYNKPTWRKSDRKYKAWGVNLFVAEDKGKLCWRVLLRLMHTDLKKLKPVHILMKEEQQESEQIAQEMLGPVGQGEVTKRDHVYFLEYFKELTPDERSMVWRPEVLGNGGNNGAATRSN